MGLATRLAGVAERFTPEASVGTDRARAIVLTFAAGVGGLAGLTVAVGVSWQNPGYWPPAKLVVVAAVLALLATPWVQRRTGSIRLAGWLTVINVSTIIFVTAWGNRGLDGFSLPLLPALVVGAAFVLGVRACVFITVVVLAGLATLYGLDVAGLVRPGEPDAVWPFLRAGFLAATLVGCAAVAVTYEVFTQRARRRLEDEVAEHERTEEALRRARDAATAADLAKSRFLANMSHELRTPMNGIFGFCELLLASSLDPAQRGQAIGILSSSEALSGLLDDLLDFGKIELGEIKLSPDDFDLRELVDGVASAARTALREGPVQLLVEIAPSVPGRVHGDARRIRQVLVNLVSNATKFTAEGDIRVRVQSTEPDQVRFEVIDTGIGVPEEARGRIFGRFVQADESTSRSYGGSGLGLAICRHLVELMGGEMGVDSEVGVGSTFWFVMPLPKALRARVAPSTPIPVACRPLRVLVAEDNPINRRLLETMLQRSGHTCTMTEDGAEAVEAASTTAFDVILMDVQMPNMDGLEATRLIRDGGANAETPVVAITANAMAADRERCIQAGMTSYLAKPVRARALAEVLAEASRSEGGEP